MINNASPLWPKAHACDQNHSMWPKAHACDQNQPYFSVSILSNPSVPENLLSITSRLDLPLPLSALNQNSHVFPFLFLPYVCPAPSRRRDSTVYLLLTFLPWAFGPNLGPSGNGEPFGVWDIIAEILSCYPLSHPPSLFLWPPSLNRSWTGRSFVRLCSVVSLFILHTLAFLYPTNLHGAAWF